MWFTKLWLLLSLNGGNISGWGKERDLASYRPINLLYWGFVITLKYCFPRINFNFSLRLIINELTCYCVSIDSSLIDNVLNPHSTCLLKNVHVGGSSLAEGLKTRQGSGTTLLESWFCHWVTLDKSFIPPCLLSLRVK